MKFGYTIIYVSSVEETLEFYKNAFGFDIKSIHDSKDYGELDTGETTLAFASHEMGSVNLDGNYIKSSIENVPLGFELAFVTEDVNAAFNQAISAGAVPIKEPKEKPWGQIVGYVRATDGLIVEICSPISS